MNDKPEVVEFRLDALTRSTRFVAGIAPRTATRVGLGVALALEDAAVDPVGELLGVKIRQATAALASEVDCVSSAVRRGARRLVSETGPLSKVAAVGQARGLVSQAVSEIKSGWTDAGYVKVEIEVSEADGSEGSPSEESPEACSQFVESNEEVNEG